ncbi:hypothetical protein : Uncharacterized protein OS=Thermodesulfatator indicus (strain DSM 15286 / JCM 11887 / CIR29812) GN=Thein_1510 PE=4 SV=1 [Gemmataceae bacterium]|nr:hypothetical protein : Uncharacterized protein OS=Thermodesulfatator indicus (strain DSM 15286 / JCM 11887 / CIR29812) GN=Thein_1510 PE=4 SV=1 [Gemmataceae bacterium]VTT97979.1 hypothetical protein : Uncharacterized protein OS=Thermodesulfatator indicus (strain DSM 15286 / JCM 11887 / CIR29812) GN=Thein_1510 PE=4 SV=1 [Gemmataceae bacterium]
MPEKVQTTAPNDPVTNRQERVASALACGNTIAAASRACKVSQTIIHRWFKQPAFKARVAELRNELTNRAIGRLADMMAGSAADALASLLDSKSDTVRLDSVKAVYDLFINVTNAAELKNRIEQLESAHAATPGA